MIDHVWFTTKIIHNGAFSIKKSKLMFPHPTLSYHEPIASLEYYGN